MNNLKNKEVEEFNYSVSGNKKLWVKIKGFFALFNIFVRMLPSIIWSTLLGHKPKIELTVSADNRKAVNQ